VGREWGKAPFILRFLPFFPAQTMVGWAASTDPKSGRSCKTITEFSLNPSLKAAIAFFVDG